MAGLKLVLRVELDEEQLMDILESYDVKPTKANLAKLKRDMKENDADYQMAENLSSDIENEIGEWISQMDWEDKELVK
jgi:hypothetical protein